MSNWQSPPFLKRGTNGCISDYATRGRGEGKGREKVFPKAHFRWAAIKEALLRE